MKNKIKIEDLKLEELKGGLFPYNILGYKVNTENGKDDLFYSCMLTIIRGGYNTEPDTLIHIANDTECKEHYKHIVLCAQLMLTYFEQ